MRRTRGLALLASGLVVSGIATAQGFPTKSIRLIVPFPPGGGNDNVARPIAAKLGELVGQQVIIDNRPGAGTMLGAEIAAKANPDGYTLFFGSIASHAISPKLYSRVLYDPIKDFEPVSLLATAPTILVTTTSLGYATVKDLVAAAKASPGKFSYGSAGSGTPPHLNGAIFLADAGIDMLHVPYKGGANLLPDVIAGRVHVIFDTAASSMPYVKSGRLKPVAIARTTRLPDLPDVPTFAEAGYPKYQTAGWYGVLAPARTPAATVDHLHRELVKALATSEVRERMRVLGADPVGSSPKEFGTFIRSELDKYARVIKETGAKAD